MTDYDCWKDDIEPVDAQHVLKVMGANVENVKKLLVESIKLMAKVDWTDVIKKNKVNVGKSVIQLVYEPIFSLFLYNVLYCHNFSFTGCCHKQCDYKMKKQKTQFFFKNEKCKLSVNVFHI